MNTILTHLETNYLSIIPHKMLFSYLVGIASNLGMTLDVSKKSYKFNANLLEENETLGFSVKLLAKDEDFSLVEFQKVKGNALDFYKKCKMFRDVLSQIEAPVKDAHMDKLEKVEKIWESHILHNNLI